MKLQFTKMEGLGNDFVVFDAIHQQVNLTTAQLRHLADRHFGVGCDQILLVEKPTTTGVDFRYRIFNADGSEVAQCGNGARCFARFVHDKGLHQRDDIVVETDSGVITLYLQADQQVRVNMGVPSFDPATLPMLAQKQPLYQLELPDRVIEAGAVSMGNPHITINTNEQADITPERYGALLESHPLFPKRVNVGFMRIHDRQHLQLRVYERGSGETLACGTGACAAMAIAHQWNMVDNEVSVKLPGGELTINWSGNGEPLWMIGAATTVFEGHIDL